MYSMFCTMQVIFYLAQPPFCLDKTFSKRNQRTHLMLNENVISLELNWLLY